ncbi:MAG: BREX-1 system adenine-specific DNA-methyltransferase PglX [Methyloprofundus sp.]|nr:BREX-1 system adenine-specific DNA-methyltransferase PglX [Methyloprofundus sp.]
MSSDSTKTSGNVEKGFFRASAADFKKIPGSPIAYWVSEKVWDIFGESKTLGEIASPKTGMRTGDNEQYMRLWYEVDASKTRFPLIQDGCGSEKWVPYNKGGAFRKWYGNFEFVVNWDNDGFDIKENTLLNYPQLSWDNLGWKISNEPFYFNEGVTWTDLSSSSFGVRYLPAGFIFDASGPCLFGENPFFYLSFLVTKQCFEFLKMLNPTLHFKNYNISALPIIVNGIEITYIESCASKAIAITKSDWDSYETSWDFTSIPLLQADYRQPTLKATFSKLRVHWQDMTLEMQRLEQENNRIFIDAYGLQDELTPDVPLKEITLTCNPHYRYGNNKNEEELETLLLADTMKEFVSYAVGCMFGRYSLDKPGLILANQGETIEDYYKKIKTTEHTENTEKDISNNSVSSVYSVVKNAFPPDDNKIKTTEHTENTEKDISNNSVSSVYSVVKNAFPPDDDNVIPMLDGDWFTDDITERFCKFLKVTFGDDHYEENITFIEQALGKDIRKYFLKDFYSDHVRRYKKRPIYWLFSSPKGTFNALIYMHRYRPDTVSVVLNDYLREFRTKLSAHKNHLEAVSISGSASPGEKTKALKDIENHRKMIDELDVYEREVLYPLATEQVEIDLDDGVKVNYQKFGEALKKIPGLAAKED